MNKTTLAHLHSLNPITDEEVTTSQTPTARENTWQATLRQSGSLTAEATHPLATGVGRRRVVRLVVRTALPAVVAAGVLAAVVISRPDAASPADHPTQPVAHAVQFVNQGKDLVIRIVDPTADPERINKELADRGLNIRITLPASSPSIVGADTGIRVDGGATITESTEPTNCWQTGARPCIPVFRIPQDFKGSAKLEIGRPAEPGEQYERAGVVDAPGELLHGVHWKGRTVAELRAVLAERNGAIAEFRVDDGNVSNPAQSVPDNWYVADAVPWKPSEILVWARPTP
jgi:hypothetical protein